MKYYVIGILLLSHFLAGFIGVWWGKFSAMSDKLMTTPMTSEEVYYKIRVKEQKVEQCIITCSEDW